MKRIFTTILCICCGIVAGVATERAIADGEPSQRVGTITKTIKPADVPSKSIEERLAALEKRVEDLEHGEITELKDEQEDEAREKKLEARLALLEKARQKDDRGESTAAAASGLRGNGPLTVRSPFIVQNGSGETIFEIGIATENNQPELVLGHRDGARARLGVTRAGGASIALYDSANAARLAIVGNPAESLFRLGGRGQAVDMAATSGTARLNIQQLRCGGHARIAKRARPLHLG